MSNLLSGLGKFGLGSLEKMELFEDEEAKKEKAAKAGPKIPTEEEFLFDKSYDCPVCDTKFSERTVRSSKARLLGIDTDLRTRHEYIDLGKYDVVSCPNCGYTVLSRFFAPLSPAVVKLIKANISEAFIKRDDQHVTYSYEYAFERYQLCLANTIVKRAKDSEKAYVCLKTAWILRGMGEHLDETAPDYEARLAEAKEGERGFLKHAFDGFIKARTVEGFPMCGMDEMTLDYLVASLAVTFGQRDVASRMISGILSSQTANARIKEKARDLKELVLKSK